MNIKKLNEKLKKFIDPRTGEQIEKEVAENKPPLEPTEEDLDDIYDCLQTLIKCEYFVTEKESKIIYNTYKIIEKMYNQFS